MGMGLSGPSQHIHLHSWANPHIKQQRKRVPIRFVLDGLTHPNASQVTLSVANDPALRDLLLGDVSRKLSANQRAVLLRVFAFYIHNELDVPVDVQVRDMFDVSDVRNQEATHPDDTGRISVYCPPSTSLQPTGVDQLLYRPRTLVDETITKYAGLEQGILESRTQALPGFLQSDVTEVFEEEDPLVEFILSKSDTLKATSQDISLLNPDGKRHYQIRQEFLKQIRDYFRVTVFDELRYTRFEEMRLHVDLSLETKEMLHNRYAKRAACERPEVFIILEFTYIVVTPGELRMRHSELRLK